MLSGDEAAFEELVRKYEPYVVATIIGMLGRCLEADDVGQETFVRFYHSISKLRHESSIEEY